MAVIHSAMPPHVVASLKLPLSAYASLLGTEYLGRLIAAQRLTVMRLAANRCLPGEDVRVEAFLAVDASNSSVVDVVIAARLGDSEPLE